MNSRIYKKLKNKNYQKLSIPTSVQAHIHLKYACILHLQQYIHIHVHEGPYGSPTVQVHIYKWLVGKRKLTTELSPKGLPRSYKVNQASRNLSSGEFRADVTEFLRFGLLYLIEAASRMVIILYKASFFFSSIFLALSKLFKAETSRLCVSGL